jgi:hypothetical protein
VRGVSKDIISENENCHQSEPSRNANHPTKKELWAVSSTFKMKRFLFLFRCIFLLCVSLAQGFVPTVIPNVLLPTTTTTTTTLRLSTSDDDTTSSFDMNELRQRIDQEYTSYVPIEGAYSSMTKERRRQPDKVHVVIFQAGTINQGAHTIEYPKGSGNNVVLAFESIEACQKFAASLQEQNFVDPTVSRLKEGKGRNDFLVGLGATRVSLTVHLLFGPLLDLLSKATPISTRFITKILFHCGCLCTGGPRRRGVEATVEKCPQVWS